MKVLPVLAALAVSLVSTHMAFAVPVSGVVGESPGNQKIENARVTLFSSDLQYFRETRTRSDGTFGFQLVGSGTYSLGVAALNYNYQERSIVVAASVVTNLFTLTLETNGGRWTIVGNTEPELLDGSGSGTLLPSGEVFFCHDSENPIMFEPVTGAKWYPPSSGMPQGCHMVSLNTDGGMFLVGGSMGGNPQDPVVALAKSYFRTATAYGIAGEPRPGFARAGSVFSRGLAVAGASAGRTLAGAARAGGASTRAVLFRLSATGLFRLAFVVFLHSSSSFFSFVSSRGYYHRLSKVQRLPTELTHVSVIHYSPSPGV